MLCQGINDTVHGWIRVPDYLLDIIETPLFQRLGYVSQLTLSAKVFPGANHTRKEHSLGVMTLANTYGIHLGFDSYTQECMNIAAILHDIGHGPYSHSWDRVVYSNIYPNVEKGHDEHRKAIVEEKYADILDNMDVSTSDVIDCWNNSLLHQAVLQGPLGCDRMDFTSRDTLYAATKHFGHYDINRIIENSSVVETPDGERLCYNEKIYPDIIQALETRTKMYENIYYHKTSIAMQLVLEQAIMETKDELKFEKRTRNLDEFIFLNDMILSEMIPISDKAKDIYFRKFPKLRERTILVSSECNTFKPGLVYEDEQYCWTSLPLTTNFEPEFSKYDIYVQTKKQGCIKFSDFWRNQKESRTAINWNLHRIYK